MPFPTVLRADLDPTRWLTTAALLLLSAGAAGCGKKVVAAAPAPVPLAVPVVPPRVVGPVIVPEERPQPVAEAPAAPPPRPTQKPRPGLAVRPPDAPVEAGTEDAQRARAEGAEGTTSAAPPLLRTRETANDAEAVKKVRDVLYRAEQNLAKVNYKGLSANGKQQADTARRFIAQAGDALERRQLTFALSLADKAEQLSTSLVNR
jgi:hypothetical protein